ncbi:hypothetical protein HYT18_02560 [Candidatus Microgenomates bacterium]|nr:hypothetical protein [Candidatus Microgenomates bacterium]
MRKSTKLKSATSFKETAFGILPRSEIVKLETEGIKKAPFGAKFISHSRSSLGSI